MTLISCRGIVKEYGNLSVLRGIDFDINEGERIGIVGNNGAGKTTLANILFGSLTKDGGNIIGYRDNLKIGYMLQSASYTMNIFGSQSNDEYSEQTPRDFFKYTSNLGLKKVQAWDSDRLKGLSGGEKTKLVLAEIWDTKPNLLILDEPTNHMDFQGVEWLLNELSRFDGTILIISHDRYFLDKAVTRIVEIEDGTLHEYPGNYSFYREEKDRRFKSQLNQYLNEKKYRENIEEQIDNLSNWASKAHRESRKKGLSTGNKMGAKEYYRAKAKKMDKQVKSKVKKLEKLIVEGVKKPKEEQVIKFSFNQASLRGNNIIEGRDVGKSFESRTLFKKSSFYVKRGERVGLIGPNGCGKTTLVKIILGEESISSGEIWVSKTLKTAYLSQSMDDLNEDENVLSALDSTEGAARTHAQTLLSNMGFDEDIVNKKVKALSLGERTRIKIAKLILQDNDVLILDEPTNHLDLHSRESLEKTLQDYNGTILLISHDRYMLEKICDKLLVFEDESIKRMEWGFREYMDRKERPNKLLSGKNDMENKMIIENRIACVISELGNYKPEDEAYIKLDAEFKELIKMRQKI